MTALLLQLLVLPARAQTVLIDRSTTISPPALRDTSPVKSLLLSDSGIPGSRIGVCAVGLPTIDEAAILQERVPQSSKLKVPESCLAPAKRLEADWFSSDILNWQQIANRVCSAQLGWRERVPGTCQAGGPPPICPVDHWYKVPTSMAMDEWRKAEAELRAARLQQMIDAACGCWRSALESADSTVGVRPSDSAGGQRALFSVPCVDNTCPSPYTCNQGYCVPPTDAALAARDIGEIAADQAISIVRDKGLDLLPGAASAERLSSKVLNLVFSRWNLLVKFSPYSAAADLLVPTPGSTEFEGYERQLAKVGAELRDLMTVQAQLEGLQASKDLELIPARRAERERLRDQLTTDIQFLDEYYRGATRERQMGGTACYSVFEYQHQSLLRAWFALQ